MYEYVSDQKAIASVVVQFHPSEPAVYCTRYSHLSLVGTGSCLWPFHSATVSLDEDAVDLSDDSTSCTVAAVSWRAGLRVWSEPLSVVGAVPVAPKDFARPLSFLPVCLCVVHSLSPSDDVVVDNFSDDRVGPSPVLLSFWTVEVGPLVEDVGGAVERDSSEGGMDSLGDTKLLWPFEISESSRKSDEDPVTFFVSPRVLVVAPTRLDECDVPALPLVREGWLGSVPVSFDSRIWSFCSLVSRSGKLA